MISLLKKASLRSCFFLKQSFCFAQTSNVEFHKAVLASKIIQQIKESPLNDYQSKSFPSLKETILQIIDTYESKNRVDSDAYLIKQAAAQVRNCFGNGVYVPYYMCSQSRNSEQAQKFQQVKNQGGQIEILNFNKADQSSLPILKKLTFCPTYVITGQIFRRILKPGKYKFLTGQQGVGKTYSFILYTLLSEMIFRYRHQHCSGKMDLPSQINFKIPKSIYLSVNLSQSAQSQQKNKINFYREEVNKIFKWHCYQLQQLWTDQKVFPHSYELYEKYLTKLETDIVFFNDQINQLASATRQAKYRYYILNELEQEKKNKQALKIQLQKPNELQELLKKILKARKERDEANQKLQKAQNFIQVLNEIISFRVFQKIIYLSSVDIEQNVLASLKLMGDSKQGNIKNYFDRLQYPITLHGNIAIADTCELITLNLKSLWIQQNINSKELPQEQIQMLERIKKQLNVVMRKQLFLFVLPLKISEYIKNIKNLRQLSYNKFVEYHQEQLSIKLIQLVEKIQEQSIKEMVIKFGNFLEKKTGDQKIDRIKTSLGFQLWDKAQNILKDATEYTLTQDQIINTEKAKKQSGLGGSDGIKIQGYQQLHRSYKDDLPIFQQLFTFQSNYLVTYLNPLIIQTVFNKKRDVYYRYLLSLDSILLLYSKSNRSMLGNLLEANIIEILSKGRTCFEFNKNNKQNKNVQTKHIYQNISAIKSCFKPIPKINTNSYSNFYFLKTFETYLNIIRGDHFRSLHWNLLLPLEQSYQSQEPEIIQKGIKHYQIDKFSKLIDFALCLIFPYNNLFIIQLFDVTSTQNDFLKKIQEFLIQFLNFKDKTKKSIRIGQNEFKVLLYYNVITTQKFDNNFQKHFSNRIQGFKDLKNKIKKEDKQKLSAFQSFNYTNRNGSCQIKGVKKEFFLKQIRVISLVEDEVKFKNLDAKKPIELEQQIFEKLMTQLKMNYH